MIEPFNTVFTVNVSVFGDFDVEIRVGLVFFIW